MAYRLRYSFDPGSGTCLWSINAQAEQRFDYPVQFKMLPISENLRFKLQHLVAWFDTCIDWDYPPGPSPWSEQEAARFAQDADATFGALCRELGPDFELVRSPAR